MNSPSHDKVLMKKDIENIRLRAEIENLKIKLPVPIPVMTDSYKLGHFLMYPPGAKSMTAYGEFRSGLKGMDDDRFVFYGLNYILETYLDRRWTLDDVRDARQLFDRHNTRAGAYPFPGHLFEAFIREYGGYFPVKIQALPEGTVAHVHTPVFIITAEGKYSPLVTYLETLLTMVWYPTTVATLSRHTKELIRTYFKQHVDDDPNAQYGLEFKLHDFGFRACTCVEQSIIGGRAHLLNFQGTDTMTAAYDAQVNLNEGRPVGYSVLATEHSVMTSWPSELEAMKHLVSQCARGNYYVACVMDSYDYQNALDNVLPIIAKELLPKEGEDMQLDASTRLWRPSGDGVDRAQGSRQMLPIHSQHQREKGPQQMLCDPGRWHSI